MLNVERVQYPLSLRTLLLTNKRNIRHSVLVQGETCTCMHYARKRKCYSVLTTFELRLDPMYIDLLLKAQHAGTLLNHRFPKFLSPQTYAKNQHAECMLETCTFMQSHNPTKQVIKSSIWRCQGSASLLAQQLPPPMLHGDPSRVLVVHVVPARMPATNIYLCVPTPPHRST